MVFTILDILELKNWWLWKYLQCESFVFTYYHANKYIEEEGVNKYLVFDYTNENKELLKKYNDVFDEIRGKIKEACSDECDYEKNYMSVKFNSDDNLPLNKPLKFHIMSITIRSVFKEDGKLYPQVFLDDTLYKL